MPATLSIEGATNGWLNPSPMYGIVRKNCTMVPKKSPKSPNIPKHSTTNPMNDHFIKINNIPVQKHIVPLNLVGLVKNVTVRWGPIIKINPITNNMFPNAKNAESKNVIIPNKKKKNPPAVNPTPNSVVVSKSHANSANSYKKSPHTLSFRQPNHIYRILLYLKM